MSQARIHARRLREELELAEACADLQEGLADAKAAHDAAPTAETLAAKRAAMTEVAEFRTWVRAVARVRKLRGEAGNPKLKTAERDQAVAELAELEPRWGSLVDGLDALRPSAGAVPLPPGSASVSAKPAKVRARVSKAGA